MQEEWKDIEGFSRYKVSNLGEVFDTKLDRLVAKQVTGIPQYYYVNMNRDDGERKLVRVHRLVAEAFVEGWSEEFDVVDHIDRNKFNNLPCNLRWTDRKGNFRNLENNIYVEYKGVQRLLIEVCEELYEDKLRAYSYLVNWLDIPFDEALDRFNTYTEYDFLGRPVVWKGEKVFLNVLCDQLGKSYHKVLASLNRGMDTWNAVYDVPTNHFYSLEVPSSKVTGYWYANSKYLAEDMPYGQRSTMELFREGKTYEEMLAYDSLDHRRQTVCGVTGTIVELCAHFGLTMSNVQTRMGKGMTLEEALIQKPLRVKKVKIDGVSDTPKNWYQKFGIEYRKAKSYKDRTKCSFEEVLKHFDIDLSDKVITYGD